MSQRGAKLVRALRRAMEQHAEDQGTGRHRATVLRLNPLLLDVHGLDLNLDSSDVTITAAARQGLAVDDVVVVLEVDEGEWSVIAVEPPQDEAPPAPIVGAFVGEIVMSGVLAPGPDWLACDGAGVTTARPELRQKLLDDGAPWGMSGSDPRVPNLKDTFPIGPSATKDPGDAGGEASHALTTAEMPAHNHGGATGSMNRSNPHSHQLVGGSISAAYVADTGVWALGHDGLAQFAMPNPQHANQPADINHEHAISSQGSGTAHNNLPPWLAVPYFIYAGEGS